MNRPTGFSAILSLTLLAISLFAGCSSGLDDRPAARQPRPVVSHDDRKSGVVRAASQDAATPQAPPAEDPKPSEEGKAVAGDAAKGKELFEQCSMCHTVDSDEEKMGPSLKGLYKKEKLHNSNAVNDASVTAVIREGGNGMPGYDEDTMPNEDLANLLAYLRSI